MLLIWGLALTIRSLCTCMNEHIEKKGKGTPHKLNRELNWIVPLPLLVTQPRSVVQDKQINNFPLAVIHLEERLLLLAIRMRPIWHCVDWLPLKERAHSQIRTGQFNSMWLDFDCSSWGRGVWNRFSSPKQTETHSLQVFLLLYMDIKELWLICWIIYCFGAIQLNNLGSRGKAGS